MATSAPSVESSLLLHAQSLLKSYTHLGAFLLSGALLLLSVSFQLWRSSKRCLSFPAHKYLPLPPGRFGFPFLGETLDFLSALRRNVPWEFVDDQVARYGEIFKTHLVGDPTIFISNPAGNKMIFTSENKLVYVSGPACVISVVGKRSLIALLGDEAKRVRHALMTFLRPETLQMYTGKVDKSVQSFIKEHWEGKSEVKVFPLMKRFAFSIACELLMSRFEKEEQEMLEEPFTVVMKGTLQVPIYLPGTRYFKAMAAANVLCRRLALDR